MVTEDGGCVNRAMGRTQGEMPVMLDDHPALSAHPSHMEV
jgi:hypothetical protein